MLNNAFAESDDIMLITKPIKDGCGFVVPVGDEFRTFDNYHHSIEYGRTGVGKSESGSTNTVQSICNRGESAVIVDPKGEIYTRMRDRFKKSGYTIKRIDFRDPYKSQAFNPLSYPHFLYNSNKEEDIDTAMKICCDLSQSLFPDNPELKEPFWNRSARNATEGAMLLALDIALRPEDATISSVIRILSSFGVAPSGSFLAGRSSSRIEAADAIYALMTCRSNDIIRQKLATLYDSGDNVARDIYSTALEPLQQFVRTKGQKKIFEGNDIKIEDFRGDKKFVLFIILPDETPVFNMATGIILSQLSIHLINEARKFSDGKLPIRVNFIVEELGNIGSAFPNLPHLMTAGRSRNIRMFLVVQSFTQLCEVYGLNAAETIRSNAGLSIVFSTNDPATSELYSKLCGRREILTPYGPKEENLIEPCAISGLRTGQALILLNEYKFVANLPRFDRVKEVLAI